MRVKCEIGGQKGPHGMMEEHEGCREEAHGGQRVALFSGRQHGPAQRSLPAMRLHHAAAKAALHIHFCRDEFTAPGGPFHARTVRVDVHRDNTADTTTNLSSRAKARGLRRAAAEGPATRIGHAECFHLFINTLGFSTATTCQGSGDRVVNVQSLGAGGRTGLAAEVTQAVRQVLRLRLATRSSG